MLHRCPFSEGAILIALTEDVSMKVETVEIQTENGPVRINKSDLKEGDKVVGDKKAPAKKPTSRSKKAE